MTIASLSSSQMCEFYKANGFEVLSDELALHPDFERIVLGKDGKSFVLKVNGSLNYFQVQKRVTMSNLTVIPESIREDYDNCLKAYNQHIGQLSGKKIE